MTTPLSLHRSRVTPAVPANAQVASTADRYIDRFDNPQANAASRKAVAHTLVNEYYDLVTDFYLWGWGDCFHFAPRYPTESFPDSLKRHEMFLAMAGEFDSTPLKPNKPRILDIGCGVGGPMRTIARFSSCEIIGVNNNPYQITQAEAINERSALSHLCSLVRANFMQLPFTDNEMDGAYAIEATCHAADKVQCYSEVARVIKPGAFFVGYEWIITPKFDPKNPEHCRIRHSIEKGNALPELETPSMIKKALENSGFDVIECTDLAEEFANSPGRNIPWYAPLQGEFTLANFKSTTLGRMCTSTMVRTLELLRLAPQGSSTTAAILEEAAVSLVEGGKLGIFSPMLFFKAQKRAA